MPFYNRIENSIGFTIRFVSKHKECRKNAEIPQEIIECFTEL